MSILRRIFGPSKKDIWEELCNELGFELVNAGLFKGDQVVAKLQDWTITLDTYNVSTGKTNVTYTRMRAPFVNPNDFKFKIYRKGIFSELGKILGMQDVEVGFSEFDQAFVIKGTDQEMLKELFGQEHIRKLIELQPKISLEVKSTKGLFDSNPKEYGYELYFQVPGVIKNKEELKALFFLFAGILKQISPTKLV